MPAGSPSASPSGGTAAAGGIALINSTGNLGGFIGPYMVGWIKDHTGGFGGGLIAMLLVKYLQLKSTFSWSLSNLVALLRQQLFVYRDLFVWLNDPFQAPPALAGLHDAQMTLIFGD